MQARLGKHCLLPVVLGFQGCVITSDVIPAGDDSFLVTGRTGDFGADVLTDLLKKANAFCAARGEAVEMLNQSDRYNPVQVFGARTGRLYFKCTK